MEITSKIPHKKGMVIFEYIKNEGFPVTGFREGSETTSSIRTEKLYIKIDQVESCEMKVTLLCCKNTYARFLKAFFRAERIERREDV